jgi:hypothetical protein
VARCTVRPKSQPIPSLITYERVREALQRTLAWKDTSSHWFGTLHVLDILNGYDGGLEEKARDKSRSKARDKLQHAPGYTHHRTATSAQMAAVRRQLEHLVDEKLAEKQRGGRSNNGYVYRWLTPAITEQRDGLVAASVQAKALARRLSLALGGTGDSGVQPIVNPDGTIGVRVSFSARTANLLLGVLDADAETHPDRFADRSKHFEIISPYGEEVMGCCWDRSDVLREEPDAGFREVAVENCSSCHGTNRLDNANEEEPTESAPEITEEERELIDLHNRLMGSVAHSKSYTLRLWDGMDGCWTDVATGDRLTVLRKWAENTKNGTKQVSFNEIDYYRIFPADTKMLWDGSKGREMNRPPE